MDLPSLFVQKRSKEMKDQNLNFHVKNLSRLPSALKRAANDRKFNENWFSIIYYIFCQASRRREKNLNFYREIWIFDLPQIFLSLTCTKKREGEIIKKCSSALRFFFVPKRKDQKFTFHNKNLKKFSLCLSCLLAELSIYFNLYNCYANSLAEFLWGSE